VTGGSEAVDLGVVLVAAGSGTRFGDADKVFAPLAGRPLLEHSLRLFAGQQRVRQIVVVLGEHTLERGRKLACGIDPHVTAVIGGATRTDSVRVGVAALAPDVRLVAVHDAARPLLSLDMLQRLIDAAARVGAAVPVVPISDTVYITGTAGNLERIPDRSALRAAQTPQVARRDWLERVLVTSDAATDEGSLLHAAGYPVALVDGDPENIKITLPRDLRLAESILAAHQAVI
jgi:2-C-methyl-D-erythritol 4-phosphate cytidylyltransferase